ncbi:MAG: YceD family protein [Candidatus Kryptonium sp.]
MKINISRLSDGEHFYTFIAKPSDLSLDEQRFNKPVYVEATLEKSRRQFRLKANVYTVGRFQCDRCVEDFDKVLENSYNMYYVYDEEESKKYEPEEVVVITPETNEIDISDDVRQMVLLSVPMKILCYEECLGLCPRCGKNLNFEICTCKVEEIDPRWAPLLKLMESENLGKESEN